MRLFIIASKYDTSNKLVGYIVSDVENIKGGKIYPNFIPTKAIIDTLISGKATIENATVQNNELVGTNGSLDRYTKLDQNNHPIDGKTPLIILRKIENLGYEMLDYTGKIAKYNVAEAIQLINKYGIANGKLVQSKESGDYISPISGQYKELKLSNKLGNRKSLMGVYSLKTSNDNTKLNKDVSEAVNTTIQYKDTFSALSDTQRKVISQYYIWYTTQAYERLAHSKRLNMPQSKVIKLEKLKGTDEWQFAGINDAYLSGNFNAKCELGHKIQYEYLAIPSSVLTDEVKIRTSHHITYRRSELLTVQQLKDAGAIVFGETCSSDFFSIKPEDMKKLVKVRMTMSDETSALTHIISNNLQQEFFAKTRLLCEIVDKLLQRGPEAVKDAFGEQIGTFLLNFKSTNIPYPMSLALLAAEYARNDMYTFFEKIFPERKAILEVLRTYSTTVDIDSSREVLANSTENIYALSGAIYSLKYITKYTLEGMYQYDPLHDENRIRKDVGKYNDETRAHRRAENSQFIRMFGYNPSKIKVDINTINEFLKITEINTKNAMEFYKAYNSEEYKIVKEKYKEIEDIRSLIDRKTYSSYPKLDESKIPSYIAVYASLYYIKTKNSKYRYKGLYKSYGSYIYTDSYRIFCKKESGSRISETNLLEYANIIENNNIDVITVLRDEKADILELEEREKRNQELLRQEVERKAREEAERKAREEAERKAREEAEQAMLAQARIEEEQKKQEEQAKKETEEKLREHGQYKTELKDSRYIGLANLINNMNQSDEEIEFINSTLESNTDYVNLDNSAKSKLNNIYFKLIMENSNISEGIEDLNVYSNKSIQQISSAKSQSNNEFNRENSVESKENSEKNQEEIEAIHRKDNYKKLSTKIDSIIAYIKNNKNKEVSGVVSFGYKVCLTVYKSESCSDKQAEWINKAYNELANAKQGE